MMIRFFLNDHRFELCKNAEDCEEFLKRLVVLGERALSMGMPVFYDGNIFLKIIRTPDVNVSRVLQDNRELKSRLSRLAQQFDRIEREHEADAKYTFCHLKKLYDVTGTMVAHAYEYSEDDFISCMLNFNSSYPGEIISVLKNEVAPKDILSHGDEGSLVKKLQALGLLKRYYTDSDTHRPNDYETILTDTNLFEPTEFGNRNNRLYRRIDVKNELWCLDRGHSGSSAHLEVFRESDGHQIHVSRVDRICFFRGLTDDESKRILEKVKMG